VVHLLKPRIHHVAKIKGITESPISVREAELVARLNEVAKDCRVQRNTVLVGSATQNEQDHDPHVADELVVRQIPHDCPQINHIQKVTTTSIAIYTQVSQLTDNPLNPPLSDHL